MEFYWAYADYEQGMELVEEMYKYVVKKTFGTLKFNIFNFNIDLNKKWKKIDYRKAILDKFNIDVNKTSKKEVIEKLNKLLSETTKNFDF